MFVELVVLEICTLGKSDADKSTGWLLYCTVLLTRKRQRERERERERESECEGDVR